MCGVYTNIFLKCECGCNNRICRKTNEWAAMLTFKKALLILDAKRFVDVLKSDQLAILMLGRQILFSHEGYINATIIEVYHALYNVDLRNVVRSILCIPPWDLGSLTWEKMKNNLRLSTGGGPEDMSAILNCMNDSAITGSSISDAKEQEYDDTTGCKIRPSRRHANGILSDKFIILAAMLQISMLFFHVV